MGRSGHSLNISFASGSSASCNLFIIRIRCRDAWITFSEKGRRPKFVKRKWKIENNDSEEVQFQTLQKAPARRAYEERNNFPPTIKKRHSTGCSSISLNKQRFVVLHCTIHTLVCPIISTTFNS